MRFGSPGSIEKRAGRGGNRRTCNGRISGVRRCAGAADYVPAGLFPSARLLAGTRPQRHSRGPGNLLAISGSSPHRSPTSARGNRGAGPRVAGKGGAPAHAKRCSGWIVSQFWLGTLPSTWRVADARAGTLFKNRIYRQRAREIAERNAGLIGTYFQFRRLIPDEGLLMLGFSADGLGLSRDFQLNDLQYERHY